MLPDRGPARLAAWGAVAVAVALLHNRLWATFNLAFFTAISKNLGRNPFGLSVFVSQNMSMFMAELNPSDLDALGALMQAGTLTPVIDRRFRLAEVPAAIAYLEAGRARGKVVINIE